MPDRIPHASPPGQAPNNGFLNEGKLGVAVYAPPGTYRITQVLEIVASNIVLRGAGVS